MKSENLFQSFDTKCFNGKGLNCQAIFNINSLPTDIVDSLTSEGVDLSGFTQLIILAHRGTELWQHIQPILKQSSDPIDDFSAAVVTDFFQYKMPDRQYAIIYPGERIIGLQHLGELAGWHYPSPFRVGINVEWGSWFAYRIVLLADTNFEPTSKMDSFSPCIGCEAKVCITSCPAESFDEQDFVLAACIEYRLKPDSLCRDKCLSRLSCPVAKAMQYSDEQLHYHYSFSMKAIERYYS